MTDRFAISKVPFCDSQEARDAVTALTDSNHLTLYCGAGTTIDRTTLGWKAVVEKAFKNTSSKIKPEHLAFLKSNLQPQEFASALYAFGVEDRAGRRPHVDDQIAAALGGELYLGTEWGAGLLCSMLAELARAAAALGKSVTIVTTNYDTHIEDQLHRVAQRMEVVGMPCTPVTVVTDLVDGYVPEQAPVSGAISLVYLHGRISRHGGADGTIVLTERQYAETREHVVRVLTTEMKRPGSTLLVLGSSLQDPPLIDALALTADIKPRPGRFAVVAYDSLRLNNVAPEDAPELAEYVKMRAAHLGVNLLVPDFKSQIAQFCEEAKFGLATAGHFQAGEENPPAYQHALGAWWSAWNGSKLAHDNTALKSRLHKHYLQVNEILRSAKPGASLGSEKMRIELWVRDAPSPDQSVRRLARWATSDYIRDGDAERKWCPIGHHSEIVTVKAFVDGRPRLENKCDAQSASDPSATWKSFLAVPVYASVNRHHRVPLGVVTLASNTAKGESILDKVPPAWMEALTDRLIRAGEELLMAPPTRRKRESAGTTEWLKSLQATRLDELDNKGPCVAAAEIAIQLEAGRLASVSELVGDLKLEIKRNSSRQASEVLLHGVIPIQRQDGQISSQSDVKTPARTRTRARRPGQGPDAPVIR